jgi:hypothetical protein
VAAKKSGGTPRRESPIQFRPGSDLGHRVTQFSATHGLADAEACRNLIALAVSEMDCRYYPLVRQFADGMGAGMDFVRACIHIKAMIDGAALAAGPVVWSERDRAQFILKIVTKGLAERGVSVNTADLPFPPVPKPEPAPGGYRRKIDLGDPLPTKQAPQSTQ